MSLRDNFAKFTVVGQKICKYNFNPWQNCFKMMVYITSCLIFQVCCGEYAQYFLYFSHGNLQKFRLQNNLCKYKIYAN